MKKKWLLFLIPMALVIACLVFFPKPACFKRNQQQTLSVDVYDKDKAFDGTTIFADNHVPDDPKIIEVDMEGNVTWEFSLPSQWDYNRKMAFGIEPLANGNVLIHLSGLGIKEIDREGNEVWEYRDENVDHDVDRLANGNTLMVFGADDKKEDAQVKEVNKEGKIVWQWHAKDHFSESEIPEYFQGFVHTNAVSRLANGNTLISLRNFDFMVEVDSAGNIVRKIGEGVLERQHDPEILSNGNILLANHSQPNEVLELDPETNDIVWRWKISNFDRAHIRDANRLPNGNTLVTDSTRIIEVTREGEIVWQISLKGVKFKDKLGAAVLGFYKAERL